MSLLLCLVLCIGTVSSQDASIASMDNGELRIDPAAGGHVRVASPLFLANSSIDVHSRVVALEQALSSSSTSTPPSNVGTCSRCSPNAICSTLASGAAVCSCDSGYRGSGFTCTAINKCVDGTHNCSASAHSLCLYQGPGQYSCACELGFSGDGSNCTRTIVGGNGTVVGGVWIGEETRDFNEVAQRKLGWSIIKAGDVDGDGIDEWAVGCPFHNDVSSSMGAIMILFMRDDGSVRETSLIKSVRTRVDSQYGYALALLGDINEDGIPDLMVGVPSPESGTSHSIGFVYTSTLSHDGQLYTSTFIDYEQLFISVDTEFGSALAVGDIDGDGVVDLFIGEPNIGSGKIHLVYMHANGTVDRSRNSVTLALGQSSASRFGSSVCIAGDLQNLGLFTDVYMGSPGDNVVYHRTFNRDGTVVRSNTILPQSISASDEFGASIATIGDLNGDGVVDLVVGVPGAASERGSIYILLLFQSGMVKSGHLIEGTLSSGLVSDVTGSRRFGQGLMGIDWQSGVNARVAVGTPGWSQVGDNAGAIIVVQLKWDATHANVSMEEERRQSLASGGFSRPLLAADLTGSAVVSVGDLDGDGIDDVVVGEKGQTSGTGGLYVLYLRHDGRVKRDISVVPSQAVLGVPSLSAWFGAALTVLETTSERVRLIVGAPRAFEYGQVYLVELERGWHGTTVTVVARSHTLSSVLQVDDHFGASVASLGSDRLFVVGAPGRDAGGADRGALALMKLTDTNAFTLTGWLSSVEGGFRGLLVDGGHFGSALTSLGDVNGDTTSDIAVATDTGVFVVFLDADGFALGETEIVSDTMSQYALGGGRDVDQDGIPDLLLATSNVSDSSSVGHAHLCFLNFDGSIRAIQSLTESGPGASPPSPDAELAFGTSIAFAGFVNDDSHVDVIVGVSPPDQSGFVSLLFLK